jgi:hypothetical protein
MDGLDERQQQAITAARQAFGQALAQFVPEPREALYLSITAIAGTFADILAASQGSKALADVVNTQLRQAGWELVPLRPHQWSKI